MKYSHTKNQVSLFSFQKLGFDIPKDHFLVKLADQIDWNLLVDKISTLYSNEGRNSKSIRMMIALEIAKTQYKGMSDEMIVSMLQTDIALMCFCGFDSPLDLPSSLDSSTMTKFRNRLTADVLQSINEEAFKGFIKNLPPRKRGQVASDTTCLPANITYPTDTKLLSKSTAKMNEVIDELRATGASLINRGKRKIKKIVDVFNKKRRKTKQEIKRTKKLLIHQVRRQIRSIKKYGNHLSTKSKKIVKTIEKVLEQQIIMYKEGSKKIKNRIVSLHEKDIRPIFRGKLGAMTEFGKKVSLQVIGQGLILPGKVAYNNFSDTEIPQDDIEQYERIFNKPPKEYSFDRGGHSPKNHDYLKEKKIHDGIEYRGRIPKKANLPPPVKKKRMSNQRSAVEGKIGTLKTRYGLNKIPYKAENTEIRWHIGIFIHNVRWMVNTS